MNKQKKSETHADWWARIIGGLGVIVATLSWFQSYNDSQYTREQDTERLEIFAEPIRGGKTIFVSPGKRHGIVQIPWKIILSNTGKVNLTLRSKAIHEQTKNGVVMFTHLDGGLTNLEGQIVNTPIDIEAGKSVTLTNYIGIRAPKEVIGILIDKFNLNDDPEKFDYNGAFRELARHGTTIYGGSAEMTDHGNDQHVITYQIDRDRDLPEYVIRFVTSRGNVFGLTFKDFEF